MFAGISIWQLLIVLAIVVMLFGTKKLRNLGGDLGGAIKGFKQAMTNDDKTEAKADTTEDGVIHNQDADGDVKDKV